MVVQYDEAVPGSVQFAIGASVECEDGPCGVVSRVVVDPVRRAVTHLVVEPQHQHALARLVPVATAQVGEGGAVRLDCTIAELGALPHVQETEFLPSPGPWMGYPGDSILTWPYYASVPPMVVHERLPPGEVEIRRGERIHAADGAVGRVEGVVVDAAAAHQITHVLVQEGHLWGKRDVAIPAGAVERIDEEGVHVSLAKDEIAELPEITVAVPRP